MRYSFITAAWCLCALPLWAQVYNLPLLVVETQGQAITADPKIMATLKVMDHPGGNTPQSAGTDYEGPIGIDIRGQTSAHFDKKGYGIKLRIDANADTSVALLGMPAEADWVLHGPFVDKTLIRNALAHHLYRETGRYSSRSRFVEFILNGNYEGIYLLLERIKRDKNRIAVSKMSDLDIEGDALTGGYVFRIDKTDSINSEGFLSATERLQYLFHYPKKENLAPGQETYLRNYINGFESLMASNTWNDPIQGYSSYLDIDAAIDYILHSEMTKNSDAYLASFYMHKDRDSKGGKFQLGPPWDFNLAYGCVEYNQNMQTSGWQAQQNMMGGQYKIPSWLRKIFDDPTFRAQLSARWAELRSGPWHSSRMHGIIDSLEHHLQQAAPRNFQRWPVLGAATCVNLGGFFGSFCFNGYSRPTWAEEITYIRDWSLQRIAWIDGQFQFTEPGSPVALQMPTASRSHNAKSGLMFDGHSVQLWHRDRRGVQRFNLHGQLQQ